MDRIQGNKVTIMEKYNKFEEQLIKSINTILENYRPQFKNSNITYSSPNIERWKSPQEDYESEFEVTFYKDGKFFDIIENHIFRKGKPVATLEEFEIWFRELLMDIPIEEKIEVSGLDGLLPK